MILSDGGMAVLQGIRLRLSSQDFFPLRLDGGEWGRRLCTALACALLASGAGCRSTHEPPGPSIRFTHVPSIGGGPNDMEHITGRVINGGPDRNIVIYALNKGTWYVQPLRSHAMTGVSGDGTWDTPTHLGTDYGALLVVKGYRPAPKLRTLPTVDGTVLAVATTKASDERPPEAKVLHFSGYDWQIRSFPNNRGGGELCDYEASNAWVDEKGYLHLMMAQAGDMWHCAGIRLTRSLGYGTYRIVISDGAHLPPSAIFTAYTQDADGGEMGIEIGRWGKTKNRNGDYVIQPYYIPENTVHFELPAGPITHVLRWEPGSASFTSFAGNIKTPRSLVMEHVFKSGVPVPSRETLHLDFYDFHHSQSGLQHPVEIVVQKFEYLP